MLKKIIFCLVLGSASYLSFSGSELSAKENDQIARLNWNININTGFYPCYPGPYYCYPYPPPCAYPYPPPYWVW